MAVGFASMGLRTSTPAEMVAEELCGMAYAAGALPHQASATIAAAMKQAGWTEEAANAAVQAIPQIRTWHAPLGKPTVADTPPMQMAAGVDAITITAPKTAMSIVNATTLAKEGATSHPVLTSSVSTGSASSDSRARATDAFSVAPACETDSAVATTPTTLAPAGVAGLTEADATAASEVLGKRVAAHQAAASAGKTAVCSKVKREEEASESALVDVKIEAVEPNEEAGAGLSPDFGGLDLPSQFPLPFEELRGKGKPTASDRLFLVQGVRRATGSRQELTASRHSSKGEDVPPMLGSRLDLA